MRLLADSNVNYAVTSGANYALNLPLRSLPTEN